MTFTFETYITELVLILGYSSLTQEVNKMKTQTKSRNFKDKLKNKKNEEIHQNKRE